MCFPFWSATWTKKRVFLLLSELAYIESQDVGKSLAALNLLYYSMKGFEKVVPHWDIPLFIHTPTTPMEYNPYHKAFQNTFQSLQNFKSLGHEPPGKVNWTFGNRTQSNSIQPKPSIEFDWVQQSNKSNTKLCVSLICKIEPNQTQSIRLCSTEFSN